MLSAWNRKKNRSLPPEEGLTGEHERPSDSTSQNVPSTTTLTPPDLSLRSARTKSSTDSKKPQARSGRIELSENHTDLCQLFNDNRVTPGQSATTALEPKSTFEWDSDEEVGGTKVSKINGLPRFKKSAKTVVSGTGECGATKAQQLEEQLRKFAELYAPQNYGGSPNAFKDLQDLQDIVPKEGSTGGGKTSHVNSPSAAQVNAFSRDASMRKRSSVLKLFDDPIWKGESGTRIKITRPALTAH
jgi:hypothetical protein